MVTEKRITKKIKPKQEVRISIRCTKKEKSRIDKIAKKRGITLKDCVLHCIDEKEDAVSRKEHNEYNNVALIASVNNILSEVNNWEKKHGSSNESAELIKLIGERVNETWKYMPVN